MKSINLKKLILPNLPYLLFIFLFDKVGQAARLAPGADLSGKLLSIGDGFAAAFSSFAPSLHPADLLVGVLGAALIRLVVYVKGAPTIYARTSTRCLKTMCCSHRRNG